MFLKKRKAKISKRGFYLQDKTLNNTQFQPGNHFKYIIDNKNKEVVIVPTEEKGNTVSRRALKEMTKPVIDIRKAEVLALFAEMDHLEVTIFNDKILVQGFKETSSKDSISDNSLLSKAKKVVKKVSNVFDITKRLELKKQIEIVLSKEQISKAAGSYFEQMSIFDYLDVSEDDFNHLSRNVQEAVKNSYIPLELVSLFSGAGMMDEGFKKEGFDIKLAVELDKDAVKTYKHNHGDHVIQADIRTLDKSIFADIAAPLTIGGPSCKGWSPANRRTSGKGKYLTNPDNFLLKEYIKSIRANPEQKVWMIENVPRMLLAENGAFKDEIINELSDFEITYGILDAADFGAAQHRERTFIIGSKIGRIELPKPTVSPGNYRTVGDAFKGLHNGIPNQLDSTKPGKETIERMMHIKQGENWSVLPPHLMGNMGEKTHSSIFKRLREDKPSISIANARKSQITHPTENRTLSVREAARLFGLDDTFEFLGGLSAKQQQVCNGVAVPVARALAKAIKYTIQQFNIRNGFGKLELS